MNELPTWLLDSDAEALSDEQLAQLESLFAAIFPGDPARGIPSANNVGAAKFVSRLLARDAGVYWEIANWKKLYPAALSALDAVSQQRFQTPLKSLASQQATELIQEMEKNLLAGLPPSIDQPKLFKTLLRHCLQGCLADPGWQGQLVCGCRTNLATLPPRWSISTSSPGCMAEIISGNRAWTS